MDHDGKYAHKSGPDCECARYHHLLKPLFVLYTETKSVYIDYSGKLQKAQIDTASD